MTDEQRDRHLGKRTTVRPSAETKTNALRVLKAHGWTLNDFVEACLLLVAGNPKDMLRSLERFRPPPKLGRPPKTRGTDAESGS